MNIDNKILEHLKEQVALKFGTSPKTPTDFNLLSADIYKKGGRTIGVSTLKRIWGYVSANHGTSYSSLTILCRYLGFQDWDEFAKYIIKKGDLNDTSGFNSNTVIVSSHLMIGTTIVVNWGANKFCKIKKIKDPDSFVIEASGNIKLQNGDRGRIESLVLGKPFISTDTIRNGEHVGTYTGALRTGITSITFTNEEED